KDEFDDITISKIRFLEAEGLINPDRTESGYRKFTEGDVDRLRYVLRAQRDRYLPLKVIRDELDRRDAGLPVDDGSAPAGPADLPATAPAEGGDAVGHGTEPSVLAGGDTDVELSLTELADASGLDTTQLRSLMDHGLLEGPDRFDGDDLRAARAAGELLDAGLEARHLRMYRQFADRELALYQQLVTPLLRQRNPGSRKAAEEQVEELAASGARLHRILLGRQLRALLRS
ncbi:MAG: MerR family transcriptional regulator, partial [Actinobacteria bacterium]|nr:MerR family transcriptional regulator [Actinomycetota bacterium]